MHRKPACSKFHAVNKHLQKFAFELSVFLGSLGTIVGLLLLFGASMVGLWTLAHHLK